MILDEIPRVDEIWINELVTYQKIYQVLDQILELKEKTSGTSEDVAS